MLIRNKFNGYSRDGSRVYPGGGGGTSTSYTSNIPEYLQPYAETMLGATQKQLFNVDEKGEVTGFRPFAPYGAAVDDQGNILNTAQDQAKAAVAGFSPLQQQAQSGIANMQVPGQTGAASDMTASLAGQALSKSNYAPTTFDGGYTPTAFTNQYTAPAQYGATTFAADKLSGFGGGTKEASTQSFTDAGTAAKYMSPYTQNVTNIQTREAQRAADIAKTQLGAQAVGAGAFGGGRQAIMEAEAARNLAQQKGDITAKGQQEAYQQAMQQFNAEQGYGLTAQQANLQAGLQSALANQQQGLTAQQLSEQSKQFGYGQQMTAAQQAAQYGLAAQQAQEQAKQYGANLGMTAQQAAEQSKQYGAGLGMQGIAQSGAMANQLGALGQQQYGQEMGILGAQAQAGAQQQQLEQARINQAMQNYATQQQYPLMQLGVMSNMLRGLPMQASTTSSYAAQPSTASQFAGAAGTGMQIANQAKQFGFMAKGGEVKSMAAGGIATGVNPDEMPYIAKKMGDQQIGQKLGDAATDNETKSYLKAEADFRKQARNSGMAAGGVIAFEKGSKDAVEDEDKKELGTGERQMEGILAGYKDKLRGEAPPADVAPPAPVVATAPAASAAPVADANADMMAPPIAPATPTAGGIAGMPELKAGPVETKLAGLLAQRETEAAKPLEQRLQEQQALKQKFGIDPSFLQDAIEKQEKRKSDLQGEAKDEAMNRFAEFLMTWGSTPGPTMVAAAKAGREYIANTSLDKKERKRLLAEADGVITDLNKSIYLEKSGSFKDAQAQQIKAGDDLFNLTEKVAGMESARGATEFGAKAGAARDAITANAAMARTMAQMQSEEARAAAKGILEKELKRMEVNKRTDYMNGVAINYDALVAGGDKPGAATMAKASSQYLQESKQYDIRAQQAEAATTTAEASKQAKINKAYDDATYEPANAALLKAAKIADKKAEVNPGDADSATRAAEKKIRDAVTAQFNPPASAAKPAAPTADAKPAAEHVVGKIYEDASGNKAEYTGNPDSPWKVVK